MVPPKYGPIAVEHRIDMGAFVPPTRGAVVFLDIFLMARVLL